MREDFVPVFSTSSWVEGEIAKDRLEAEGTTVDLKGPSEGPYPTGPAELAVRAADPPHPEQIVSGSNEVPD
jgi:hypothetical protein